METIAANSGQVSIIVPVYNYARFLESVFENLLAQSYPNWECLLVDDGSRDETAVMSRRLCERDTRILYYHQENAGPSAARNVGLRECHGEFIQFLDADDLLEPRKFEAQIAYLMANPDVDIVYGDMRYFADGDVNDRPMEQWGSANPWLGRPSGTKNEVLRELLRINLSAINAPLLRRSVIEEVGVFDSGLRQVEDWDFWLRCALAGRKFAYDGQAGTLAMVRSHAASASRDRRSMLATELKMRSRLNSVLDDRELLRINRVGFAATAANLGLLEGFGGSVWRGTALLYRAASMTGKLKWLAYALLLPLATNRWGRSIVRKLKPDLVG